jgi:hypothetical protein
MDRACRTHGEERNARRILARRPEEKRPLGGEILRREDNTVTCLGFRD